MKNIPGEGIEVVQQVWGQRVVGLVDPLHDGQGGQLTVKRGNCQNALQG